VSATDDQKLQQIEDRRQGPELQLHGAELDREMAVAAGDEERAAEAEDRMNAATAQLAVLDDAVAKLGGAS
jgi:hypothetical protein